MPSFFFGKVKIRRLTLQYATTNDARFRLARFWVCKRKNGKKFLEKIKKGIDKRVVFCYNRWRDKRWCGSMAEQLICNQQVDGSTPFTSSIFYGGIPERPKGADCKSVVTDFAGPNPASPTIKITPTDWLVLFLFCGCSKFGQGTCFASALVRILREAMSNSLVNRKREYLRLVGYPASLHQKSRIILIRLFLSIGELYY